jgi:two-component system, NtrC family, sensor histidine kinase HydH
MAVVTMRHRLVGPVVSRGEAASASALAVLAMVGYLGVFRLFGTNGAVLVVATTALTFALLAVARKLMISASLERSRLRELSTLGSFSAQLAHDLKNPLAALKGAAQFLKEEKSQGRSLDDNAEFVDLMAAQIDRIESVIEHYQRWSRVEAVLGIVDINHLVSEVLGLQELATSASVRVVRDLQADLPACRADRDLLVRVLTNLLQNGLEAMPEGGELTVRTAHRERGPTSGVLITVEDSGHGMDARTRERAFDDFYTTKASGTGLGLPFVRRVLVAHGGGATLTSRVGRGTAVLLWLPTQPILSP